MRIRLSRRAFLTTAGGGVALAAGTALWRFKSGAHTSVPPGEAAMPRNYVDVDGWMLTDDERKNLQEQDAPTETPE